MNYENLGYENEVQSGKIGYNELLLTAAGGTSVYSCTSNYR